VEDEANPWDASVSDGFRTDFPRTWWAWESSISRFRLGAYDENCCSRVEYSFRSHS
jgi:hypothetical protein